MKLSSYRSEFRKVIDQRNGYLLLAISSVWLCLLLIVLIFILVGREKIILVPPMNNNKDTWVASNKGSEDYLSKMTLYLTELSLNTTAENVDYQQKTLLQYVDPAYYGALKTQLGCAKFPTPFL